MGGWEADLGEVTEVDGVLYRAGVCGEIVRGPCSAGTTVGMIVVFLLLALVVVQVVVVDLVREWNPSEVAQQLIDRPRNIVDVLQTISVWWQRFQNIVL